jgi:hypothetical protein
VGSDGIIEVGWAPAEGPMLRFLSYGQGSWQTVDTAGETLHGPGYHERAIAHVVHCLQSGEPSELHIENQINSIQIVFGAYESARSGGRVELPPPIDDNPLLAIWEQEDARKRQSR